MSVFLSDTNPNETSGGGGCLVCGPRKNVDQRGPFAVVVNENEMESNVSPAPVVCATCLDELNTAFASEALSAGEKSEAAAWKERALIDYTTVKPGDVDVPDEEEVPSL